MQNYISPLVYGFNASGCNGLILKFSNTEYKNLKKGLFSPMTLPTLYPNPCSTNTIYLQNYNNKYTGAAMRILNSNGQHVKECTDPTTGHPIAINLSGLPKGQYILLVTSPTVNEQIPFIKF